jgi:hypothetical protein
MERIKAENIMHDGSGHYTALFKGQEMHLQATFPGATAGGMEESWAFSRRDTFVEFGLSRVNS